MLIRKPRIWSQLLLPFKFSKLLIFVTNPPKTQISLDNKDPGINQFLTEIPRSFSFILLF